jgi:hypothetical protein
MTPPDQPRDSMIEDVLAERAAQLNQLIETCHERRECPKCLAPIGSRCRAMPRGYSAAFARRGLLQPSKLLKHPHRERYQQEVPVR